MITIPIKRTGTALSDSVDKQIEEVLRLHGDGQTHEAQDAAIAVQGRIKQLPLPECNQYADKIREMLNTLAGLNQPAPS